MDNMSKDQLKGAIRNMEGVSNMLHDAFNVLIKQYADEHCDSVLDLDFDSFDGSVGEFYLPAINGGTVIISKSRLDSLIKWKLEFFAEYGNLRLDIQEQRGISLFIGLNYSDRFKDGYSLWTHAREELSRASARLYESMSNQSKPQ